MFPRQSVRKSPITDNPLRNPGQSLDEELHRIVIDNVAPWAFGISFALTWMILEWFRWLTKAYPHPLLLTAIVLPWLSYAIFKLYRIRQTIKRLRIARDGEKAVGQYLSDLREQGHRTYHDVIGSDFNIDHVIISDRGIYTVETKTYSKPETGRPTIVFDGEQIKINNTTFAQPDAVIQAQAQAKWLQTLLKESTGKDFAVKPVIVFPGWFIEATPAAKLSPVWVLNPKALPGFLNHQPQVLAQEDVQLASYHLSRYIRTTSDRATSKS